MAKLTYTFRKSTSVTDMAKLTYTFRKSTSVTDMAKQKLNILT
jgi:hypothetical protein